MENFLLATAATRCISQTFTNPSIFGLETVSITANVVSSWTLDVADIAFSLSGSIHAQNGTQFDFCNVSLATTHPGWGDLINTEVWLPLQDWNGRMVMTGGGGLSTGLSLPDMTIAMSDGFSSVSTDGGHFGEDPSTWALASPGNVDLYKLLDYSTTALHEAVVIGKSVTKEFYGQNASFAYFAGCSTGGRQGLMFAQRFPEDFDGILAASPGLQYNTMITAGFYPYLKVQAVGQFPHPCELTALMTAAIEECDPKDGVTDGIISAPELCTFDPFSMVGKPVACEGRQINLTYAAALGAQETWTPNMTVLWYGLEPGSDLTGALNTTCSQTGTCEPVPFPPLVEWLVYWLEKDPSYDYRKYTVQEMIAWLDSPTNKLYDSFLATDDINLTAFHKAGGKMITWHGLADQYIPPSLSQRYYDELLEVDPAVPEYYRYFQAPGVQHCIGGAGPYPSGVLESLVDWVEHGVAPHKLEGVSPPNAQGVVYQRPICEYPLRARYRGQGNVTQAASWICK